jgi:hypothetical protein
MSKKTASSQVPEPEFTFDNGISIADFFSYEAPNGEGLLDSHRLMDSERAIHNLPDGLLPKFANNPFNPEEHYSSSAIDHAITDPIGANVTHLEWLDMAPFTGVNSPEHPVDIMGRPLPGPSYRKMVKELEAHWGGTTDGVFRLVENNARNVKPIAASTAPKYSLDKVKRSAKISLEAGKPLEEITNHFRKLASDCGCPQEQVDDFADYLDEEYGLAGNVYVDADNYPNLLNGKYKDYFQQKFAGVRYLIASSNSAIASQYKTFWGKIVTQEVPWDEAYNIYSQRLVKAGYRVASGNPKESLRAAFLSAPVKEVKLKDYTQAYDATKYVTYKEAYDALKKASASPSRNLTWEQEVKQAQKKAFTTQMREETLRMVKAGYLEVSDVEKASEFKTFQELWKYAKERIQNNMVQSALYSGTVVKSAHLKPLSSNPDIKIDTDLHTQRVAASMLESAKTAGFISDTEAAKISALPHAKWYEAITKIASIKATRKLAIRRIPIKHATYSGEGLHIKDHVGVSGDTEALAKSRNEHFASQEKRIAEAKIQQLVSASAISQTELARIQSATQDAAKQLTLANRVASLKLNRAKARPTESAPAADYSGGYSLRAIQGSEGSESNVIQKRASEQKPMVLSQIRSWMNQGIFGKNLTNKIASFYGDYIPYLKDDIVDVRKTHEGSSGFEYIDAGAYADIEGPKGCHAPASMKIAAKVVLACSSCATCPMAKAGTCTRFQRPLVASVRVPLQTRKANTNPVSASLSATLSAPTYVDTHSLSYSNLVNKQDLKAPDPVSLGIKMGGNVYE